MPEKEKTQKTKLSIKEKIGYLFADNWPFLLLGAVAVLLCVSMLVKNLTQKQVALECQFVCAVQVPEAEATLQEHFFAYSGIDPNIHTLQLSATASSLGADTIEAYTQTQLLFARVSSEELDVIVSDQASFPVCGYQNIFLDLREVFSETQLEQLEACLLYIDGGYTQKVGESLIYPNPEEPDRMENPIPCALKIPVDSDLAQVYPFLEDNLIVGVVQNAPHRAQAKDFLTYVMDCQVE